MVKEKCVHKVHVYLHNTYTNTSNKNEEKRIFNFDSVIYKFIIKLNHRYFENSRIDK